MFALAKGNVFFHHNDLTISASLGIWLISNCSSLRMQYIETDAIFRECPLGNGSLHVVSLPQNPLRKRHCKIYLGQLHMSARCEPWPCCMAGTWQHSLRWTRMAGHCLALEATWMSMSSISVIPPSSLEAFPHTLILSRLLQSRSHPFLCLVSLSLCSSCISVTFLPLLFTAPMFSWNIILSASPCILYDFISVIFPE